jgi:hypothetical protein
MRAGTCGRRVEPGRDLCRHHLQVDLDARIAAVAIARNGRAETG